MFSFTTRRYQHVSFGKTCGASKTAWVWAPHYTALCAASGRRFRVLISLDDQTLKLWDFVWTASQFESPGRQVFEQKAKPVPAESVLREPRLTDSRVGGELKNGANRLNSPTLWRNSRLRRFLA